MFAHESQDLSAAHFVVSDLTGVTASAEEKGIKLTFTPLPRN
jgi:hypothetical protein